MTDENLSKEEISRLRGIASNIYLADPRYRICYYIPHPVQNLSDASPFQGATNGMVATARLLEAVMIHPADVRELSAGWPEIALFRTAGLITHRVMPAEYTAFMQIVTWDFIPPFRCVVSSDENAELIDEYILPRKDEWLHISTKPGDGRQELQKLTRRSILDYVLRRLDQIKDDPNCKEIVPIIRSLLTGNLPSTRISSLPSTGHNLARPNEMALQAFGSKLHEGPESPITEKRAVKWILRSADFVARRRRELLSEEQAALSINALLLTLPATYRGHRKREYLNKVTKYVGKSKAPPARIIKGIIDPQTYIAHFDVNDPIEILGNEMARALLSIRHEEMRLYSATLIRISAESLLPTLRLIPNANRAWGKLKHLADCVRSEGPRKKEKLRRLFLAAQIELETGLDEQFLVRLKLLKNKTQGIKLVTDLPLEWLRVDGVPLTLRHECSRIPAVPSSLSYAIATNQDPVLISRSQLTDILIIRSFEKNDPIRLILEHALDSLPLNTLKWPVKYRFVDVNTPDEIVDALNNHAGAIIVFDCHGSFETEGYYSSLIVGGKQVHLWKLRALIKKMPPIVLLSACDTLPVDGSHASAASGMLLIGARTVLGTLLPIDAKKAAIFISRLFLRIGEFVPIATNFRKRVSWREVVSGMTKMMHMTECLRQLLGQGVLDNTSFETLHLKANIDINNLNPNWFECCVERLAKDLKCTFEVARKHLSNDVGLTEALLYVQLGNPELLILLGAEADSLIRQPTETIKTEHLT